MDSALPLPEILNLAVGGGAAGLLLWLGRRAFRTPLWVPILLLCTGMIAIASLDLAADLAGQSGALNAQLELDIAAASGTTVTLAGLLHFAAMYPRRVETRWVGPALLLVYAVALLS